MLVSREKSDVPGPLWPWVVPSAGRGGLRQQLKIRHRFGTVTHRSTDTVVPGITTANYDDILALRTDVVAVLELRVEERLSVHLERMI